jgi:hypothetical protein
MSIIPIFIDTILVGLLVLPWLRGQEFTSPDVVNVVIGLMVGIALEALTQMIERSRSTREAVA